MELELKITCNCHQVTIAKCCQMPLVATIAPKVCIMGFFILLNPNLIPNLQSDLLFDRSRNTS